MAFSSHIAYFFNIFKKHQGDKLTKPAYRNHTEHIPC